MSQNQPLKNNSTFEALKKLILKNGMPEGVYVDNGQTLVSVNPENLPKKSTNM